MKNVLFITGYPAPYMVDFFNLLGCYSDIKLSVAFTQKIEDQKHRSKEWFKMDYKNFEPIFIKHSINIASIRIYIDLIKIINSRKWDEIIFGIYHEVGAIIAQIYLKICKIPYSIEIDGGIADRRKSVKNFIKKYLVSNANKWYSNGLTSTEYLKYYGAKTKYIYFYPL